AHGQREGDARPARPRARAREGDGGRDLGVGGDPRAARGLRRRDQGHRPQSHEGLLMSTAAGAPSRRSALLETDLDWKRRIIGLDAPDLSLCYQCGTCTAVCPISSADNPFPRKEMVWVQWGLKERALGNASIWLCHQCGTCNAYCPRDAKPSNVMAALREDSIAHYAVPRFMGRALGDPRALPLLFALPAVILLAVLAGLGHLGSLPAGRIVFSRFLPIMAIEAIFLVSIG